MKRCPSNFLPSKTGYFIEDRLVNKLPAFFHELQLQHFGLRRDVGGIGFMARRSFAVASQKPDVRNAGFIERIAVRCTAYHARTFELPEIGPAAIQVLC